MKLTDFGFNAYKKTVENSKDKNNSPAAKVLEDTIKSEKSINIKSPVTRSEVPVQQTSNSTDTVKFAIEEGGLLKVPVPAHTDGKDGLYRRVAKFMMLIGVDEAAKIMPHLSPEQTERIVAELATIRDIDKDEAASIMSEFSSLMQKARENGGVDTARNILQKAFGDDKAEQMLDKAVPFKGGKPFSYLSEASSEKIAALLKDESAAVRALVLSYLKPKVSAEYIQTLKDEEKKEVILRLAKLKEINPELLKRVDAAMEEKNKNIMVKKTDAIDGRSVLAGILKRMDGQDEESVIRRISETDPELGADIRQRLFTYEDIVNADDKSLQEKLRTMEDVQIAFVIAGKTPDFREKLLSNVSSNRRASILDEEERHKPMLKTDVEKETSLFFSALRRAWEDGTLIIKGRGEEYV